MGMVQSKRNNPVIMVFQQNEETNQLKIGSVELAVPIWGWQYLVARADALYGGDLNTTVNEIFAAGLTAFMELTEVDMEPANTLPC